MRRYLTFVLLTIILVIFVQGYIAKFFCKVLQNSRNGKGPDRLVRAFAVHFSGAYPADILHTPPGQGDGIAVRGCPSPPAPSRAPADWPAPAAPDIDAPFQNGGIGRVRCQVAGRHVLDVGRVRRPPSAFMVRSGSRPAYWAPNSLLYAVPENGEFFLSRPIKGPGPLISIQSGGGKTSGMFCIFRHMYN